MLFNKVLQIFVLAAIPSCILFFNRQNLGARRIDLDLPTTTTVANSSSEALSPTIVRSVPVPGHTTIVAACRNAHQALYRTVPSWLRVIDVAEVLLVDWSSKPPLHLAVEEMDLPDLSIRPPLTILTVASEQNWTASRAYNVAFRLAQGKHILRVDCDQSLQPHILQRHNAHTKVFFSGRQELTRSPDETHLQQVVYAPAVAMRAINGYDERIHSPGHDHQDLVARLVRFGLNRSDINYDSILHFAHEDKTVETVRIGSKPGEDDVEEGTVQYRKDLDEIEHDVDLRLFNDLPAWNFTPADSTIFHADVAKSVSKPSFRHANVSYVSFSLTRRVQSFRLTASQADIFRHMKVAVSSLLHLRYFLPNCLANSLPLNTRKAVVRAFADTVDRHGGHTTPRAMFLFMSGSLTSRLKFLGSALSFASQTDRLVIAFWTKPSRYEDDVAFNSFKALFNTRQGLSVIDNLNDGILPMRKRCKAEGVIGATTFFTFYESDEGERPVISRGIKSHIAIEGDMPIRPDVLHLSNDKTIRSQLRSLSLYHEIESQLLRLEDAHLSRAMGIYIPAHSNDTDEKKMVASVNKTLSLLNPLVRPDIYFDANSSIVQYLRATFNMTLLPTIPRPSRCMARETGPPCYTTDLARMIAMCRAKRFYSPVSDEFTRFIRFFRGEAQ